MSEATKCPKCGEEVRTGGMRDMVRSLKRQLVLALEREATEKARADKAEEKIEHWQASSMLENAAGDPGGITPDDNEKNVCALMADLAKAERLREDLLWLVNLHHDVSKGGGKPDDAEWEEALESAVRTLAASEPAATEKRRGDDEALMRMASARMHSLLLFDGEGIPNSLKDEVERLLRFIAARLGEGPAAPEVPGQEGAKA